MKKITRATLKSFITKCKDNLYCRQLDSFDGMVDCVMPVDSNFCKIDSFDFSREHDFGITGLWLVGESRDYFTEYEDDEFQGIEISNSCGSSIIAMKK